MDDKEIKPENADKIVHLFTAVHFLINIHHILEIQPFKDVETFVYRFEFYSKDSAVMQRVFGTELEGMFTSKLQKSSKYIVIVINRARN